MEEEVTTEIVVFIPTYKMNSLQRHDIICYSFVLYTCIRQNGVTQKEKDSTIGKTFKYYELS